MPHQPLPAPAFPLDRSGLFRTRLAGPGGTTRAAFERLADQIGEATWQASSPGLQGAGLAVSDDPSEGQWDLLNLRNEVLVVVSQCRYRRMRSERVPPEGLVELHFVLEGPASVAFGDNGEISIATANLTVVRQQDTARYHVHCGPGSWRSVSLYLPLAAFDAALASGPGRERVEQAAQQDGPALPCCLQIPLPARILQTVERLLGNPYQGYRRLVFAEAKASELLCMAIDLWERHLGSSAEQASFSARDLRLFEQARDLLLADPSRVPTIPELARAVGTNTSKLKSGFRHLYGMTVFELGHRHRMNHALDLLQEGRSVHEVANAVGYQHQTSFTVSFREHFGVAPKDARRSPARLHSARSPATSTILP